MNDSPSLEEWGRLYGVSIQIKELAPWQWMEETDIFAVQDPDSGQIGFVSVMGMLGDYLAISLYQGVEGLYGFYELYYSTRHEPERLLEIPAVQVSYNHREQVEKEDRAIIQQLGLKFRGRHAWPVFRSFVPCYYPWFLEADEARFLTIALEQLLEVAPRVKQDPKLLDPYDDNRYLVRTPTLREGKWTWKDEYLPIYEPEAQPAFARIDKELLNLLETIQPSDSIVEIDVFMLPNALQSEESSRPLFPYILVAATQYHQKILGYEILTPEPSLNEMRAELPQRIAEIFAEAKVLPKDIWILEDREFLTQALTSFVTDLNVKVNEVSSLKVLDAVKEGLLMMFDNPNRIDPEDFPYEEP